MGSKLMICQRSLNKLETFVKKQIAPCLSKSLLLFLAITTASCQGNKTNPPEQASSPSPTTEVSPTSPPVSSVTLIDDLENNKGINKLGGGWITYDDKGAGGDSKVMEFKPNSGGANDSKFSALLKGEVTNTIKPAFIGMGMSLNKLMGPNKFGKPEDISQYKGIAFCAKGDGNKYNVALRSSAIPNYNDYAFTFVATSEWKCHQVPFTEMKQMISSDNLVDRQQALAEVTAIIWQPIGQPHKSVELAVDDIGFWK
jgi:hypothetical protein